MMGLFHHEFHLLLPTIIKSAIVLLPSSSQVGLLPLSLPLPSPSWLRCIGEPPVREKKHTPSGCNKLLPVVAYQFSMLL